MERPDFRLVGTLVVFQRITPRRSGADFRSTITPGGVARVDHQCSLTAKTACAVLACHCGEPIDPSAVFWTRFWSSGQEQPFHSIICLLPLPLYVLHDRFTITSAVPWYPPPTIRIGLVGRLVLRGHRIPQDRLGRAMPAS